MGTMSEPSVRITTHTHFSADKIHIITFILHFNQTHQNRIAINRLTLLYI